MSWKGRAEKKDGTKMTRLTRLQLEVETILIGLMQTEGWSSRVQADKIVDLVAQTVTGDRVPGVPDRIDPETLVVVSRPIEILKEWRLVVTDRVIAHSQYKQGHGLIRLQGSDLLKVRETPQEVLDYAQRVLNEVKYRPDPIWTLDICETADGLKVLEVGSFSCAGLYACDPEPIIEEVNRLALADWDECH